MAEYIVRRIYTSIRNKFNDLALRWNGLLKVWNNDSPIEFQGRWVSGNKGSKIQMNDTVPVEYRYTSKKAYSGEPNEVQQDIIEESSLIHTLGNENNIRNSVKELNDKTYDMLGRNEGISKVDLNLIGHKVNTDLSSLGIKKYSQLSKTSTDVYNGNQLLSNPSETSNVEYEKNSLDQVLQKDVLTFYNNENYALNNSEIVKKSDYEQIEKVLERIQMCIDKKSSWFSGGICSRTCQVSCQNRCQTSCQACNTRQCHDQKCGVH